MPHLVPQTTALTITNPLILYRSLLATKTIDPDPSQHRLALHLQKLYIRLKDYSPKEEYATRLRALNNSLSKPTEREDPGANLATPTHPLRQNPLFAHIFRPKSKQADTRALTKVLTNHEAAMELQSPQGLLLHGEVGTGKSMLLDLLHDSMPNRKKARWHFNTFMLESLSKLETLRMARAASPLECNNDEAEYSLLWLARDMIEKSPILFLDEFQLPDRAASKILSNLFTSFFQLGGVLIASSNRIPDELAKASGVEYAAPVRPLGLVRNIFGLGAGRRGNGGLADPGKGEFAGFLDVLKARCEIWEMEGKKDWRRREAEEFKNAGEIEALQTETMKGNMEPRDLSVLNTTVATEHSLDASEKTSSTAITPRKYLVMSLNSEETWRATISESLPPSTPSPVPWKSMAVLVYGRIVQVPMEYAGVAYWDFPTLCGLSFGPADYITLASTFHTIILDNVPILTILQKNEARRLITLLDALYEARCKLIIRAEAGPDDLFFPEVKSNLATTKTLENDGGDAVYPETLSEIYQDQTSPFRPNISSYEASTEGPSPRGYDPDEGQNSDPKTGQTIDFGQTSSFVGEDERFAYKRARSRLWEMCGMKWHARSEEGWWKPLPIEVRRWEKKPTSVPASKVSGKEVQGDVKMGEYIELDTPAGLQGKEIEEARSRPHTSSLS